LQKYKNNEQIGKLEFWSFGKELSMYWAADLKDFKDLKDIKVFKVRRPVHANLIKLAKYANSGHYFVPLHFQNTSYEKV
jgi:hypothetical protein